MADIEDLTEAKEMARTIRLSLEAQPPRPRWYEADEELTPYSPGSREAYLQQSPVRGRLNAIAPPVVPLLEARVEWLLVQ